jgi:hypothetical protein
MTMFGSQWLANAGATHEIEQSVRFNDGDSPYLERTPSSAGNQKINTISCWVKRTNFGTGASLAMFSAAGGDYGLTWYIDSSETDFSRERLSLSDGASTLWQANDYRLRDPASWYHFVFAMDTTQGTQSNRMKVYINGALITADSNALGENTDYPFFDDVVNRIGSWSPNGGAAGRYMEGYMAEIHLIDGAQKAASDFGKYDSTTGEWVPIKYAGAYGDQGAYLKGQDSSALGDDTSGEGNDFSSSGLAANDQMSDSPTNNWCVLNSINLGTSETLANGNLEVANSASAWRSFSGTHGVSSGKWYWEATQTGTVGANNTALIGIAEYQEADFSRLAVVTKVGPAAGGYALENYNGKKRDPAETSEAYADAVTSGQIVGVALDLDNAKIWWSINNTWQASGDPAAGTNEAYASLPAVEWCPAGSLYNATNTYNFGQNAFAYTPPTGFSALNNANTPAPAIKYPPDYFNTVLYSGNSTDDRSISDVGFSPNFSWIKKRGPAAGGHVLYDTVRGATKQLVANSTAAEVTNYQHGFLKSFDSDGFTLGEGSDTDAYAIVNESGQTYVAWNWVEGATPGFDIVSYTGNATARTISHNLGVVPKMMIVKNRADTDNWAVYHASNTAAPATDYLVLNANSTTADDATVWNDTAPTSSVFSVGTGSLTNGNTEAMIAYVFAPVEGFSAFGSYLGNANANGPMINLGFRPAFVMIKEADTSARDWIIQDATRNPFNAANLQLLPNASSAEALTFYSQSAAIDIVSNGFKVRSSTVRVGENGANYIYAAFAEAPFKTANAR